jgi:aryl-alcohol dehydrogenase-like predicted oxidoreductase
METMRLWNGTRVPRIGVGCWAIGGDVISGAHHTAYGDVDDAASIAGLKAADEAGAKLFDTAAYYGGGHSERLLGQVFGDRDDIVIVTKFGTEVDPDTRRAAELDLSPSAIRASVERSRRNLRRDTIDLLLFHINFHPPEHSGEVFDTLAALRAEKKIAAFGWSNDSLEGVAAFAERPGFVAIENDFNLFMPAEPLMAFAEKRGLVAISRIPLAMGMLTGKYSAGRKVGAGDVRGEPLPWMTFFKDGAAHPEYLRRLEAIRDLLTAGGRTLAQGALGWILAKSSAALPVPGFKTETQVRDNLGALEKGRLPTSAMAEIERLLDRAS